MKYLLLLLMVSINDPIEANPAWFVVNEFQEPLSYIDCLSAGLTRAPKWVQDNHPTWKIIRWACVETGHVRKFIALHSEKGA